MSLCVKVDNLTSHILDHPQANLSMYALSTNSSKEKIDIFFLKLVAILSAVHHIALFPHPPWRVLLWTDSLNSVAAHSSLQASEPLHNSVLLALAGILLQTGIDLCICHISGRDNIKADLLLRLMIDEYYHWFPAEHICLFSPPQELLSVWWREYFWAVWARWHLVMLAHLWNLKILMLKFYIHNLMLSKNLL